MGLGRLTALLALSGWLFACSDSSTPLETPGSQLSSTGGASSITVEGTGDPTVDVTAVQAAVDNYDMVFLSGDFDFGFDETVGGVEITRPGVTVQGPATVSGGGQLITVPELPGSYFWYLISIQAPGVKVQDLELNAYWDTGILVYVLDEGEPIGIEGNNIYGEWASIFSAATRSELAVTSNRLTSGPHPDWYGGCYLAAGTEGTTQISHNEMDCVFGVAVYPFNHALYVTDNTIYADGGDGVFIGAWSVNGETDPEWGDNPPVRVVNNVFHLDLAAGGLTGGIAIGTSAHGISNAIVKDNTLKGEANYGGLTKHPYGHNNTFLNNDLTGLTTYSPQIWSLGGTNNHFQNNRLGEVGTFSDEFVWTVGPAAFRDAATLVSPINWHLNDWRNTPDPVHDGNHFAHNDYALTGLPGWTPDPEDAGGAVLLLDFIQKFYQPWWVPYEEPFAMENYVNEKDFPAGTDLCSQVLDFTQGTNHVAGWTACEAHAGQGAGLARIEAFESLRGYVGERVGNAHRARLATSMMDGKRPRPD